MARLSSTFIGPPTLTAHTNQQSNAACFTVSEEREVIRIGWYRAATSGQGVPTRLSLWRASDSAELYGTNTIPDSGAVGWQFHTLSTPIALAANNEYRVGGCSPAGTNYALIPGTSSGTPEYPLAFAATKGRFNDGSCPMPSSTTTSIILFDVEVDELSDDTPDDTAASEVDVEHAFQRWNDPANDLYHTEGDPAVIREAVTDATSGLPAINAKIVDITTNMLTAESEVISDLQEAVDDVEGIVTGILGPSGSLFTGLLKTYLDTLQSDIQSVLSYTQAANAGAQGVAAPDDTGWDVVETAAFSGPFVVTTRCDRIYVHITDVGGANITREIEGFHFGTFPWWWVPVFSGNAGPHGTSMAREAVLLVPGMRMDGAVVVLPEDFSGTYEASRFNGS